MRERREEEEVRREEYLYNKVADFSPKEETRVSRGTCCKSMILRAPVTSPIQTYQKE